MFVLVVLFRQKNIYLKWPAHTNRIWKRSEPHWRHRYAWKTLNPEWLNDTTNPKWKWSKLSILFAWIYMMIYFIFWPTTNKKRKSKELLLNPVIISRNENERILIEGSVNSIRISIAIKKVSISHQLIRNWEDWKLIFFMYIKSLTILKKFCVINLWGSWWWEPIILLFYAANLLK